MTVTQLLLQIAGLVLTLLDNRATDPANLIVQILQKGTLAYEQQTGKPLDPNLIRAEDPV